MACCNSCAKKRKIKGRATKDLIKEHILHQFKITHK